MCQIQPFKEARLIPNLSLSMSIVLVSNLASRSASLTTALTKLKTLDSPMDV